MTDDSWAGRDRQVIQCNYVERTSIVADGARAYVILANLGGGHDRIEVLARSRSGRWVCRWEPRKRLRDFRIKLLPPEHPLHDHAKLYPIGPMDDVPHHLQDLVDGLNAAG